MIEPRLAADVRISSIKRFAAAKGCFVTILNRGDSISGAILILALERGAEPRLFEQMPLMDGQRSWQTIWSDDQKGQKSSLSEYIDRRRDRDSDLWVIELDVVNGAQLDEILLQIA